MNNSMLKALADELSQKILTSKDDGTYFSEPFQHLVIDNFLPLDVANELLRAFPDASEDCWQRSNDEGIEIKARAQTGSQNSTFPMACQAWLGSLTLRQSFVPWPKCYQYRSL